MKIILKILAILSLSIITLVLLAIPIAIFEVPTDLSEVNSRRGIVLDNVNIIDVRSGAIIRNKQIHISKGIINAIEVAGSEINEAFQLIDLNDAYIIPGLFDMHVHLHDRKYLGLYLSYGVTSVRNLRGLPMHLRWKDELEKGAWLGSNLYTSSPVLDGEKYGHALQQIVTSAEQARKLVREYKSDGYDLIKAYGYLDKDVFEAILDEAKAIGFPIAKHGPNPVEGLSLNANYGLQSLEHVEDIFQGPLNYTFDHDALATWISEFKKIEPVVTPTLATFDHLVQLSDTKENFVKQLPLNTLNPLYRFIFRESSVNRWLQATPEQVQWNKKEMAFLLDIVKALDAQNITLLLGSDGGTMFMPPGVSTHREIALMEEAGLSPIKVLQAATLNAAKALGVFEQYGSIDIGKVADLVVVNENPLQNLQVLTHPVAVVKNGQWLNKLDILALRKSGENPSGLYLSMGRLLEDILFRAFD